MEEVFAEEEAPEEEAVAQAEKLITELPSRQTRAQKASTRTRRSLAKEEVDARGSNN